MAESQSPDIANIIERAKKGDHEAFSHLYKVYFTPLYRYVYFRVKNRADAEDMVQDVFVKAYSSFSRYSYSGNSPLAYFYTIARNTVIDYHKKRKIVTVSGSETESGGESEALSDFPAPTKNPEQESIGAEEGALIREQITRLPDNQQDVIVLRFIEELSTKEIAEMLGKSEDAIRQLQSQGLRSLRLLINK